MLIAKKIPTARALLVAAVLVLPCAATAQPGATPRGALVLTGVRALTEAKVRGLAGSPPPNPGRREDWAYGAAQRIVRTYHKRGYAFARAFWTVQPDGVVWLHVDEGVVSRVVFDGASDIQSVLMRVDLSLPFDTVHGPTLDLAVAELREKYGFQHIEWQVVESDDLVSMPTGQQVVQQVLRIRIEQEESFGWGASVALDSTWGLLPTASVSVRSLAFEDDSLHAALEVGVPYRRYVFDAEPKAQWVHGWLGLEWRLPSITDGVLAPFAAVSVELSQFGRSDRGIEGSLMLRGGAIGGLVLRVTSALSVSLGAGAHLVRLYDEASLESLDEDTVRGVLRLAGDLGWTPRELRRDYQGLVRLTVEGALSAEARPLVTAALDAREVVKLGQHAIIFRQRAVTMAGDLRFFDEVPLAGETMRVFFANRWWLRETLQAEVAARFGVWGDSLSLGVFLDGAVFGDRTGGGVRATGAFGGGPGVHALFWDLFALDLYYGFGLDRVGFAHNLSFSLRTVF
ncbi:MAG: hypothetical protein AMXMBFR64_00100 [Myxococcales bacterium]